MAHPEFTRGGFRLSGDPEFTRAVHVGAYVPHCTACGRRIRGDEEYLANWCTARPDGRHAYPNGDLAPEPLHTPAPVPDGHQFFAALALQDSLGFACTLPPVAVEAHMGDAVLRLGPWRDHVVIPVVEHLLLPRIPHRLGLSRSSVGSPFRLDTIDGTPLRDLGDAAVLRLLGPYRVTLPDAACAALAMHHPTLTRAGVPIDAVTLQALAAGLTVDEILTRHADGTLDPATVAFLHGLQA